MPIPTLSEHKTVQARFLAYGKAIGWAVLSRKEAKQRRGFDPDVPPADRARNHSPFFDNLLEGKGIQLALRRGRRWSFVQCDINIHA
jgi:type I restriction enzyme R subunit